MTYELEFIVIRVLQDYDFNTFVPNIPLWALGNQFRHNVFCFTFDNEFSGIMYSLFGTWSFLYSLLVKIAFAIKLSARIVCPLQNRQMKKYL